MTRKRGDLLDLKNFSVCKITENFFMVLVSQNLCILAADPQRQIYIMFFSIITCLFLKSMALKKSQHLAAKAGKSGLHSKVLSQN